MIISKTPVRSYPTASTRPYYTGTTFALVRVSLPVPLITPCVVFVTDTCPAGTKSVPATRTSEAKCEDCTQGTFNAKDDASEECAKHNPCTDTTVKEKGTASKDVVCNPGMWIYIRATHVFLSLRAQDWFSVCTAIFSFICASLPFVVLKGSCKNLASLPVPPITPCVVLVTVTNCAAGEKLVPKTDDDDAKCKKCPNGRFNANYDNSTACLKHSTCEDSKLKEDGNSKKDTECDTGMWIYTHARSTFSFHFVRKIGFELALLSFLLFVQVCHLSF